MMFRPVYRIVCKPSSYYADGSIVEAYIYKVQRRSSFGWHWEECYSTWVRSAAESVLNDARTGEYEVVP
jgi:hypothetical protein